MFDIIAGSILFLIIVGSFTDAIWIHDLLSFLAALFCWGAVILILIVLVARFVDVICP